MSEYHKILGVKSNATKAEIKNAYRKKALALHPDRNPSSTAQHNFIILTEAYNMLSSGKYIEEDPKTKYWETYSPPSDPEEFTQWKIVDEERKKMYYEKAREEAIIRNEKFRLDCIAFRKSVFFYPLMTVYYSFLAAYAVAAISSIAIPALLPVYIPNHNFSTELIIFMSACTLPVGVTLLFSLRQLKRVIDPYFYTKEG